MNTSLVKQFDKRWSAIDEQLVSVNSRISTIQKQTLDSVNEQVGDQLNEINENFEIKINECNADAEYNFSCVVDKIEEVSHDIDIYKTNTNSKIS